MRIVLILVNLLLAVWLLAVVVGRFTGGKAEETLTVKARSPKKSSAATPGNTVKTAPPESVGSLLATIVDNNIFNPDRCPNAVFGRGRSNRVELSLVGTFKIGDCKGAIILQKSASNNRNFPGMMGGPGGFGGFPGDLPNMSQNENPGAVRRGGQSRSGSRNRAGTNGSNTVASQTGALNMMGGGGGFGGFPSSPPDIPQSGNPGAAQGGGRNRLDSRDRVGADGSENSASSVQVGALKQYVRIGETLANGYTLTEVTRTGAVLTRGSDKMELELQEPSKNLTKASAGTNKNQRTSVLQQMQQMQQMQMMQNFQMMRMMRDTVRNQNQNQNQGGNRGGNAGGGPGGPPPGR